MIRLTVSNVSLVSVERKALYQNPVAFGFAFEGEGRGETALVEWYYQAGRDALFRTRQLPRRFTTAAKCTVPIPETFWTGLIDRLATLRAGLAGHQQSERQRSYQ